MYVTRPQKFPFLGKQMAPWEFDFSDPDVFHSSEFDNWEYIYTYTLYCEGSLLPEAVLECQAIETGTGPKYETT